MADVFTDTGIAQVIEAVNGDSHTAPQHVGWGTGAGTAGVTDTTLFTENGSRVSGTKSKQTTNVTNDTYRVVATLTASSSVTITNAGLFDASSGGNLYAKGDFTGVALNNGDSIEFTFDIVLDQA